MFNIEELKIFKESLPFWKHLSEAERKLLLDNSRPVYYSSKQHIHLGDNDCVGVLIIKSGTIRIYIVSEEGREVTLYRLQSGDVCVLSASCVLQSIDFDVSIDAESDCEVLQLSASTFSELSDHNVYVELFSYKLATERFSDVMWAMQQILFISFDRRLAGFLLDECNRTGSDNISLTHEQIAKYLGSAREVVSRMLKYFSSEGYVKLSRGGITLTDRSGLKNLIK